MTDDRLVVLTQIPPATDDEDPETVVLFDGFAQVPQADVSAGSQAVTFVAQGAAIRLWDDPILGRVQRDADKTGTTDKSADFFVDLPCRFNPADNSVGDYGGYVGNSVAASDFTEDPDVGDYPVFIEPLIVEGHTAETNYWFISDAIKYLIATEPSPKDDAENAYVQYPTLDSLDDILGTYAPPDDGLLNSGDAMESNVKIRDYDASNKAVPDVMAELLRYGGFVMALHDQHRRRRQSADGAEDQAAGRAVDRRTEAAVSGRRAERRRWTWHRTTPGPAPGPRLQFGRQRVGHRDRASAVSKSRSTWLRSFSRPAATVRPARSRNGTRSNLTNATDNARRMYRWYGADECADGHWNASTSSWVTDHVIDFDPVFPPSETSEQTTWVARYRPGQRTLISKDAAGKPLKAVLELCTSTESEDPSIMTEDDGLTWTTITKGWQLLDDRLGIEVTIENPEEWHTGQQKRSAASVPVIRGVTWAADPDTTNNKSILLRLTTVIDADVRIGDAKADKRVSSPTQFTRRRSADGKDHFQYCVISRARSTMRPRKTRTATARTVPTRWSSATTPPPPRPTPSSSGPPMNSRLWPVRRRCRS